MPSVLVKHFLEIDQQGAAQVKAKMPSHLDLHSPPTGKFGKSFARSDTDSVKSSLEDSEAQDQIDRVIRLITW